MLYLLLRHIDEICNSLSKATSGINADSIALSGGLDSSIVSYLFASQKPHAISVISTNFVATDLTYCQMISKHLGLPLTIAKADMTELFDAIENTIWILKNFNDIEIRNNIVIYIALNKAKENGWGTVATGDGADELFAGYNFLIKKDKADLKSELNRIRNIMDFPSRKIARHLKIELIAPFLNDKIIQLSKELSPDLLVKKEGGSIHGKWILRKSFEDKIPTPIVWRKKSPLQDGSGTSGLTHFFDSIVDDHTFFDKLKKIKDNDGIRIRTKESLFYYETYKKYFGNPKNDNHTGPSCPDCGYELTANSKFCKMCGAYPI